MKIIDGVPLSHTEYSWETSDQSIVLHPIQHLFSLNKSKIERIFAFRIGNSKYGLPENSLVLSGSEERSEMSFYFYAIYLKTKDIVLLDSGFNSQNLIECFKIEYSPLESLDLDVTKVKKVIISHLHWDHSGNLNLFPYATVYLQKSEYDWATEVIAKATNNSKTNPYYTALVIVQPSVEIKSGILLEDFDIIKQLKKQGRLVLITEKYFKVTEDVIVHTVGGHTPGSQIAFVRTDENYFCFCFDCAYLYKNIEQSIPIGKSSCLCRHESRKAIKFLHKLNKFEDVEVIPGHDPKLILKYKALNKNMFSIYKKNRKDFLELQPIPEIKNNDPKVQQYLDENV